MGSLRYRGLGCMDYCVLMVVNWVEDEVGVDPCNWFGEGTSEVAGDTQAESGHVSKVTESGPFQNETTTRPSTIVDSSEPTSGLVPIMQGVSRATAERFIQFIPTPGPKKKLILTT